ncbi:hypothetical protein AB0G85_37475 [Streptomyces sioyaensis]|uniref:hypothetical protein n=1 Tax=Streptomyces sioyaensis TaxID=67364 RepID=UPI003402A61F
MSTRPNRRPGETTLEGQVTAAAKGNHVGRPKVIDEDSLLFARALKDRGVPVPEIAKKLTIKTSKNAGRHPSVASLYRPSPKPRRPTHRPGRRSSPRAGRPGSTSPGPAAPPAKWWTRSLSTPKTGRTSWPRCWRRPEPRGGRVIPMPPHRTKGPGVLGATPEQPIGPFGR